MVKYIKSNNKKYIKSNNNNIIRNILIFFTYYSSIFIIFNYINFNLFISFIILLFYISLFLLNFDF